MQEEVGNGKMSDDKFCELMMELRNTAVRLIDKRLRELFRWDVGEQRRVQQWFGVADEDMRGYLDRGFGKCRFALLDLTCSNFVRYSPDWGRNVGCIPDNGEEPVAQVCPTDTATRTIAINGGFFDQLRISPSKDSQVSTLIHEITHFRDTFWSQDLRYGLSSARRFNATPELARTNADNLAGYVVEGAIYGD